MNDVVGQTSTQEGLDAILGRWSAARHGVFTRADALRFGATERAIRWRLATGRWVELYRGVYRHTGTPRTWHQQLLAACRSCGPEAVASHLAAGRLARLASIEAEPIEISVPRGHRRPRKGVVIHEVGSLPKVDVTVVDAIPSTTVTRTLIDLGAVVKIEQLEEALDDALRRSLTSISRLRWRLAELGRSGRPGVAAIRFLLEARASGSVIPRSVLETRFIRLTRERGLPQPVRQHAIRENGRVLGTVDFAYPDVMLAIEVDGYEWHSGRARWAADLARRNKLTARGWRIIHVTDHDLRRRPGHVAKTVAAALTQPRPR